jgi:release factor glutamine methyltransferase
MTVRYADGGTCASRRASHRPRNADRTGAGAAVPDMGDAERAWIGLLPLRAGAEASRRCQGVRRKLDEREQRVYADSVTAAYGAGHLTPSHLLAALPQFASASVRQTVTAGMYDTELDVRTPARRRCRACARSARGREDLSPAPGVSWAFRRRTAKRRRPPAACEPGQLLRRDAEGSAVRAARQAGPRGARARRRRQAARRCVPQDLRGIALVVAVQAGGKAAFDAAVKHFRASQDAVVRGQLLGAMGSARDPVLAERARALVFEPGLLRRNEIFHRCRRPDGRSVDASGRCASGWIRTSPLQKRLAPAGAELVGLYAPACAAMRMPRRCRRRFATRMKTIEGGPLELKQTGESSTCARRRRPQGHGAAIAEDALNRGHMASPASAAPWAAARAARRYDVAIRDPWSTRHPRIEALLRDAGERIDPVDAQWLLAHVLGKSRSWLYAHGDEFAGSGDVRSLRRHSSTRRIAGEPLAYLTARKGFWRFELQVTPDTLVPRPETELLVELALARFAARSRAAHRRPRHRQRCDRAGARATNVPRATSGDGRSAAALAVARATPRAAPVATSNSATATGANAARRCDNAFDLIASNPPYIALGDLHLAGDLRYEPAIRARLRPRWPGCDPRHRARRAPSHLNPGGWLLLEHGLDQGAAVRAAAAGRLCRCRPRH